MHREDVEVERPGIVRTRRGGELQAHVEAERGGPVVLLCCRVYYCWVCKVMRSKR